MNIELKLNTDFERCLDELRNKYGEDFEKINGLHPSQQDTILVHTVTFSKFLRSSTTQSFRLVLLKQIKH